MSSSPSQPNKTQKNQLQQQLAEIKNTLDNLNDIDDDNLESLLERIHEQRWWFIGNHPDIIFDSHRGLLWPNLKKHNMPELEKAYIEKQPHQTNLKTITLDNRDTWQLPTAAQLRFALEDKTLPFLTKTFLISDDPRLQQKNGQSYSHLVTETGYMDITNFTTDNPLAIDLPYLFLCHLAFADLNFTPPQEHDQSKEAVETYTQKRLMFFTEQQWQLEFEGEKTEQLQQTYQQCMQIFQLEQQQDQLEQQIEDINNTTPFNGLNHSERKQHYSSTEIDATPSAYAAGLQRWLNDLNNDLLSAQTDHPQLFAELHHINQQLQQAPAELPDDCAPRQRFLQQHLDFKLHSTEKKLAALQDDVTQLQHKLQQIEKNPLNALYELQQQPCPRFEVVADYSIQLIDEQRQKIDWYSQHQNSVTLLIEQHQAWLKQSQQRQTQHLPDFQQRCQEELIDHDLTTVWQQEWLDFHAKLETKLQTLMELLLNEQLHCDAAAPLFTALQSHRDQMQHLLTIERLQIHQACDLNGSGKHAEQLDLEIKRTELTHTLQLELEKGLFALENSSHKETFYQWAESWLQHTLSRASSLTEQPSQQSTLILNKFRELEKQTLESLLQDSLAFSNARQQRNKEFNQLLYKMKKSLTSNAA
ncbi:MAG: hypothetical protein Q9O24_07700 [Gammaproteobacteria bacterium]|nr:hypothetical protein [Gammaproteobacteria bacterium]